MPPEVKLKDTQKLLELLTSDEEDEEVDFKELKYALYARKSTTSEDKQASSIEDQIKDCMEQVVVPNELNVVDTYQEAQSAKTSDIRDEFNRLVNDIENGRINGLIAWHPDRLSRNMKEAGVIIDLVDRKILKDLRFPTFTFENNPAGKMLLGITFVIAKQYSEHLSESVDRGNRRAVEDGEFIGKFAHGYVIDAQRRLQADSRNFTKVKHMFKMALDGKSQKDIRLWINKQEYTVQKRQDGEFVEHVWDKDNVSTLIRNPLYAGVLKWGKTIVDLTEVYDFEPMLTVEEFLKINKISNLRDVKVLTLHHPRTDTRADLLRGMVYCGGCGETLTSMIIDKREKETKKIIESRYYYKCENEECNLHGHSARAGIVVDCAQEFFRQYLFTTESNYAEYVKRAEDEAIRKSAELKRSIASYKTKVANKIKAYEKTKELIANNPELKEHYDLDKNAKEMKKLKSDYGKVLAKRDNIKSAILTYKEYLKLFESTPDILGKIRDMKQMEALLKNFFSNFTILPNEKGDFRGSKAVYELKEPYKGFVENGDFVCGAG